MSLFPTRRETRRRLFCGSFTLFFAVLATVGAASLTGDSGFEAVAEAAPSAMSAVKFDFDGDGSGARNADALVRNRRFLRRS